MLYNQEKKNDFNTSFGISSGLGAVKLQNFAILTGTTVGTAVGNLITFVDCNETGLHKSLFSETPRLGEGKVKLTRSLLSFNLFVNIFTLFCNLITFSSAL